MIIGYFGPVGSGKTWNMIHDARLRMKREACQVYSVMGSLHFPRAVYLDPERIEQLACVRSGIILCDEAGVILNGRFWKDVPRDVLSALAQSRHNGLDLYYTAQYEDQVDKGLREITSESIHCRPIARSWVTRVTHVPGLKREIIRRRVIRLGFPEFALYDTLEIVGRGVGEGVGFSEELAAVRERRRSRARRSLGRAEFYSLKGLRRFRGLWHLDRGDSVYECLRSAGFSPSSREVWRDLVLREYARREWLADFGLGWDDVGFGCTYDSPWEPFFDPHSVKEKARVDRFVDTVEEAIRERDREVIRRAARQTVVVPALPVKGGSYRVD